MQQAAHKRAEHISPGFLGFVFLSVVLLGGCSSRESSTPLTQAHALRASGQIIQARTMVEEWLAQQPDDPGALQLRADLAFLSGDYATAGRSLQAAVDTGLAQDDADILLARNLLASGRPEAALAYLDPVRGSNFRKARIESLRGQALLAQGDTDAAENALREALSWRRDHPEALIGLARVARARGDFEESENTGWRAITVRPGSVGAWRERAILEFERGNLADAESAFQRAVSSAGPERWTEDSVLASAGLAETLWLQRKRNAALAVVDSLRAVFPQHPITLFVTALFAYDDQRFDEAEQSARAVLEQLPGHPRSLQLLGLIELGRDEPARATTYLDAVLEADPEDRDARMLLARSLLGSGHAGRAVQVLAPVAEAGLQDAEYLRLAGRARLASGQFQAGLAFLALSNAPDLESRVSLDEKRIEDNSDSQTFGLTLAALEHRFNSGLASTRETRNLLLMALHVRSHDLARRVAQGMLAIDPDDLLALVALAGIEEAAGQRQDAIAWLDTARVNNQDAAEPHIVLSRYALENNDIAGAERHAQIAAAAAPQQAEVLATLGRVLHANGDFGHARRNFRAALSLEPRLAERWLDLASTQLALQDTVRARQSIRKAVLLDRAAMRGAVGMAFAERQRSGPGTAYLLIGWLQLIDQGNPLGYEAEGDFHLLDGRYQRATRAYGAAGVRGASRLLALKAFIAGLYAGAEKPGGALVGWLDRAPDDFRIRLALAQVCQSAQKNELAVHQYRRVLGLVPGNIIAAEGLSRLGGRPGLRNYDRGIVSEGC